MHGLTSHWPTLQIYSPDLRPWWCERRILVYWAWCQTCWWIKVLLLILVHRFVLSSLPLSICWLPVCFFEFVNFLEVIEDTFLFPGAICAGVWFDFLRDWFGERLNLMQTAIFEDTIRHSTSLSYFALRFARSLGSRWRLIRGGHMKLASLNIGTEYSWEDWTMVTRYSK